MSDALDQKTFWLAQMSGSIRTLTLVLLSLPVALVIGALVARPSLAIPAILIGIIYLWVWLRLRPSRFVVHIDGLDVIWPLKRRQIPRADIANARVVTATQLRSEIGWGMRIGAGGLWGGFGWLWTKRRGIVQMYVTRFDGLVWIERASARPWLITPEQPQVFVHALLQQR